MLAQIVVNYHNVVSRIHEILGGTRRREGGKVLKRGGIGGCRGDDEGIIQRVRLAQLFYDPYRFGGALTYRAVNADNAAPLLIFYRRERDRGLSRASVAYDKLSLTLSDGDHRIYRENSRRKSPVDRRTVCDLRCRRLVMAVFCKAKRLTVKRSAERIDHASYHGVADSYVGDMPRAECKSAGNE